MKEWILGRNLWLERQTMQMTLLAGLLLFGLRLYLAMPFWASGLTKWTAFPLELNSTAKYLFTTEFMLHLPGGPFPMPFPIVMAWLSGAGEIVLPILLVLGLATRLSALGIVAMTIVIQFTIPGGWPLHLQWALAAAAIAYFGAGRFSLDDALYRYMAGRRPASVA